MSTTIQQTRALPTWLDPTELVILGAIWGASFLFMRMAAHDFGPFPLVTLRVGFGALVLLPFLLKYRGKFPLKSWPKIAVIGAINTLIPFLLFAWASERAPAGVSSIANAMTVLFTALVGTMLFREPMSVKRSLALLLGFAGVLVLALGKTEGASFGLPVLAGVLAAALYGLGAHLVRRHFTGLPAGALACATLLTSTIISLPFSIPLWPKHAIVPEHWFAVIALGVFCSGIAYVMYYRLIQRIGASRASTVTYLIPLFAVTWAWIVLREPLTLNMGIACAMILLSVFISQRT